MGKRGNGKDQGGASETAGGVLVLDAGALIAFERSEERIHALLDEVIEGDEEILIPASALAQVWRGGPRSALLARLVSAGEVDALDEARAREVGERLGSRDRDDVADAHVVCCALDHDAALITSDAEDMAALSGPVENLLVVSV